jgi:hypothetical protein
MTQRPAAADVGGEGATITVGGGMPETFARFGFPPGASRSASITVPDIEAIDKDGISIEVMFPAAFVPLTK